MMSGTSSFQYCKQIVVNEKDIIMNNQGRIGRLLDIGREWGNETQHFMRLWFPGNNGNRCTPLVGLGLVTNFFNK